MMRKHAMARTRGGWLILLVLFLLCPQPSLAAGGGVSGTVRDQYGSPLESLPVTVYAYDDPYATGAPSGARATDANGYYNVGGLAAGAYAVNFGEDNTLGHAREWYDDQAAFKDRARVMVSDGLTTQRIDAELEAESSISGKVTDATAAGIAAVRVEVFDEHYNRVAAATTDAAGAYTARALNLGRFKLHFAPTTEHLAQWYKGKNDFSAAELVEITAFGQQVRNIDATLAAMGKISGRVTSDNGVHGLYGLSVRAYDYYDPYAYMVPRGEVRSGYDGRYTMTELPAGDYKVSFGENNSYGFAQEWHDNQPNKFTAGRVRVTAGATTANVNADLAREAAISGQVSTEQGVGIGAVEVKVYAYGDPYLQPLASGTTTSDGRYRVGSLNTGVYKVEFDPPLEYEAEWYNDRTSFDEADEISLTTPEATVLNIDAVLSNKGYVVGQVYDDHGPLANVRVRAYPAGDPAAQHEIERQTDASGSYRLEGLDEGLYQVEFYAIEAGHERQWYQNVAKRVDATEVEVKKTKITSGVDAHLLPFSYYVKPRAKDDFGGFAPDEDQLVRAGETVTFELTPMEGYEVDVENVTGTCGGSLSGNQYLTQPVRSDCDVWFAFRLISHEVFPQVDGNGAMSPAGVQTVVHGETVDFSLAPASNHHIDGVSSDCGEDGYRLGATYVTGKVLHDCAVRVLFAVNQWRVTPLLGEGEGKIDPNTTQVVDHGDRVEFALAPAKGFRIDTTGGTCGGSLSGATFITNEIVESCTVIANFVEKSPWILYIPPILAKEEVRRSAAREASSKEHHDE